ncbi:hypothetical protein Glove_493g45 [Diversispora epigaea]|uniref:Uncharacterized protein n=1 Tax=Diversispora epigaea TaxID=1348612 RepID=A0A397GMI4_9GLOM|nr:hypothetical protein Glove_493g45 [Diversispora epigaea]
MTRQCNMMDIGDQDDCYVEKREENANIVSETKLSINLIHCGSEIANKQSRKTFDNNY